MDMSNDQALFEGKYYKVVSEPKMEGKEYYIRDSNGNTMTEGEVGLVEDDQRLLPPWSTFKRHKANKKALELEQEKRSKNDEPPLSPSTPIEEPSEEEKRQKLAMDIHQTVNKLNNQMSEARLLNLDVVLAIDGPAGITQENISSCNSLNVKVTNVREY